MGRVYEKWHICKCLVFHAENLVKVYTQKNSGYTKSRRKIRQQKIPKINSKFLHIEILSREAWASKDTRFLTLSMFSNGFNIAFIQFCLLVSIQPNGFIFYSNRQRDTFIFRFKYNDFIFISHHTFSFLHGIYISISNFTYNTLPVKLGRNCLPNLYHSKIPLKILQ